MPFIDEIRLYGSRARGDHKERSDIDLAIVAPTASNEEWLKVPVIIENADTLLKVDYIRFDRLENSDKLKKIFLSLRKYFIRSRRSAWINKFGKIIF